MPIVGGLAAAFDDSKVAQLLATSLALEGKASDRLATIFNTIAPDEDRKRRVLTMTRTLLSESDFGKTGQGGQFQGLWASMEELLVSYNDKPFVSESYQTALDGVGGRAERMAVVDLPPDLPDWLASLGQDNVRSLSVTMLIDLFTLERDKARASEIAADMEALAEDLLLSGSYDDTLRVTKVLAARATTPGGLGRDASAQALDRLGESLAMRETAGLIGDVEEAEWKAIRTVVDVVGASTIEALKPVVMVEEPTLASRRAEEAILGFGKAAVARLASLVGDARWFVRRNAARLLGRIGSPEAVPLLQPLLRMSDPRVVREAVTALGAIDDPAAARAVHTVLRAATGELRRAVIDALVAGRDPRVVPMLVHILRESQPLGKDHEMVLETAKALGTVGSEEGLPALRTLAERRAFFGRKKLRALKEHSVEAIRQNRRSQSGRRVARRPRRAGDRMLRKIRWIRTKAEELIRRLAAALRGTELYSPAHPLVQRGIDAFMSAATESLQTAPAIVIGFIGDEIVVDGHRLPRGTASLVGFARDLRERDIEKVTFSRGLTRDEVRALVAVLSDRASRGCHCRTDSSPAACATSRSAASSSRRSATSRRASRRRGASIRRRSRRPKRCGRPQRPATSRIPARRERSSTASPGS